MQKGKYNTISFDGMADLAAYMTPDKCCGSGEGSSWYGETATDAIRMLTTGDLSQVATAEKLLSQFDIHINTVGAQMDSSVAGFAPNVPAYLGGSPESMFDMLESEHALAPLKIIVNPTSSAGIDVSLLRKRGTTILAAVMALGAMRPVQLEMCSILDCSPNYYFEADGIKGSCNFCVIRVPINSTPLDLASACFALSNPGFARRLLYGIARHEYKSPLVWPSIPGVNMRETRHQKTIAVMAKMLGEDADNTLIIPAINLTDETHADPAKWVSAVLAKYGQPELVS